MGGEQKMKEKKVEGPSWQSVDWLMLTSLQLSWAYLFFNFFICYSFTQLTFIEGLLGTRHCTRLGGGGQRKNKHLGRWPPEVCIWERLA